MDRRRLLQLIHSSISTKLVLKNLFFSHKINFILFYFKFLILKNQWNFWKKNYIVHFSTCKAISDVQLYLLLHFPHTFWCFLGFYFRIFLSLFCIPSLRDCNLLPVFTGCVYWELLRVNQQLRVLAEYQIHTEWVSLEESANLSIPV